MEAVEILVENKISPRIQVFVNKENIDELLFIFIHQGSCDGESEKFYPIRVTPEDFSKIPLTLAE